MTKKELKKIQEELIVIYSKLPSRYAIELINDFVNLADKIYEIYDRENS